MSSCLRVLLARANGRRATAAITVIQTIVMCFHLEAGAARCVLESLTAIAVDGIGIINCHIIDIGMTNIYLHETKEQPPHESSESPYMMYDNCV